MKRRTRSGPRGAAGTGVCSPAAVAAAAGSGRRPTAATQSAETMKVPALSTSSGAAPNAWTDSPPTVADSSIPAWVPIS
ncbi:hypothetical protein Sliba_13020 [Streptomyces nigrescens]|uniref:Uncharacterized protein n=1 Tax=Streptomyces nigrescens TaxID=1920 RepID=A0A640TAT4_STRNI|nr:hypothetical protein Sliba_13020 [Streptomyces libani subsp. libani]GGV88310.1 hypothetical protein GCM10010500_10420 [Streptomyces libani subsp. libani]